MARVLDVARSNLIEQLKKEKPKMPRTMKKADDFRLLPEILAITGSRPTYGYRRVTAMLNRALAESGKPRVNQKRIYRIMRQNKLLLQPYGRRPSRTHDGRIITLSRNMRWCSDGFSIPCWNGDRVAVAFALDCHDREVISWIASTRGINGAMIRDLMTECLLNRFGGALRTPHSVQWLSDNGPCYAAHETVAFGRSIGLEVCTTAPYRPESNGMAEALVKTIKRDYVAMNDVPTATDVMSKLAGWFEDYNERAPHKGLGMKSPREYISSITAG